MIIVPAIGLLDGQVQVFQGLVFGKFNISPYFGQGTMIDAEGVAGKGSFLCFHRRPWSAPAVVRVIFSRQFGWVFRIIDLCRPFK